MTQDGRYHVFLVRFRWELQATVESPPTMTVPLVMNSAAVQNRRETPSAARCEVIEILPKLPVLYHSTVPPEASGASESTNLFCCYFWNVEASHLLKISS